MCRLQKIINYPNKEQQQNMQFNQTKPKLTQKKSKTKNCKLLFIFWCFDSKICKWSQSSLPFVTSPISNVDIFQLEQFRDNAFECLKLYAFYTSKYSVFCVDCYDVSFQYFVLVSFSSPNNNSPFLKEKLLDQLFVKKNKMSSISHFIPFK
ncbi:hypothetical protein RFI_24826 [Reticulomyxa filosa]|uniref:Uncharacterized protein n=1 Tax=Reticulomyxa filosa TaxID=46433 RepID=X6MEU7_RETFI|nr:hypothetical protein RFI_24826 [Reticulomyxa filosa]|eukprot:ETO12548.1 hypothetical protein RFI_24826 [Reticulomyxa filosa]